MHGKTIFVVLFTAMVLLKCNTAQTISRDQRERQLIQQYFNYVDIISRIGTDNMLEMTKTFVMQLLEIIPAQDRGNSADMLELFIQNADRASGSDSSLAQKELVLLELRQIIEMVQSEMAKQEKEDIIIKRGLSGMFELLARLSIEERKFNEKFERSARVLKSKMSPDGLAQNRNLFEVLDAIDRETEIVRTEELMKRFKYIKETEYGS